MADLQASFQQGSLLTPYEAEYKIQSLGKLGIDLVGSTKWMQQARVVQELNLQAHHNAINNTDEFVSDLLITIDRIPTLIHELLVIEVWKDKILPQLRAHLEQPKLSVPVYLVFQHELQLINLIECTLFHRQACETTKGDVLIELVDYCCRKLVYLNTSAYDYVESTTVELDIKDLMRVTASEELAQKEDEIRYNAALCSISTLRYMTEYITSLDPGVMVRILDTNDVIMALIPMLNRPPWERVRKGNTERYEDNQWHAVRGDALLKINKHSAQVWLALNNLIAEPDCRKRYRWNSYNIDVLAGLKRHFNDILFDQLPVLKDMAQASDEIILGASYSNEEILNSALILEQVPEIYDNMVRKSDFKAIAREQRRTYFDPDDGDAVKATASQLESMLKSFEFLASLEEKAKPGGEEGGGGGRGRGKGQDGTPRKQEAKVQIYKAKTQEEGEGADAWDLVW